MHDVSELGFTINPACCLLILGVIDWFFANGITILLAQSDPGLAFVINNLRCTAKLLAQLPVTAEDQILRTTARLSSDGYAQDNASGL
jgi:hypothetical protein